MLYFFEVILRNTRELRNKGTDLEFFFLIYCPELDQSLRYESPRLLTSIESLEKGLPSHPQV